MEQLQKCIFKAFQLEIDAPCMILGISAQTSARAPTDCGYGGLCSDLGLVYHYYAKMRFPYAWDTWVNY